MPKVRNTGTGETYDVPDEQAAELLNSGEFALAPGERLIATNDSGKQIRVDPMQVERHDLAISTPQEQAAAARRTRMYREHGAGALNKLKAFGEGLWSGATIGFGDVLLEDEATEFRREELSGYRLAGDIVGTALPAVFTAGESLAARGVVAAGKGGIARTIGKHTLSGQVSRLAEKGAAKVLKEGTEMAAQGALRRTAAATVAGGIEGSLQSGLREVGRQIRDDEALDIEAVFGESLEGGMYGGVLGGGLNTAAEGYRVAAPRIKAAGSRLLGSGDGALKRKLEVSNEALEDLENLPAAYSKQSKIAEELKGTPEQLAKKVDKKWGQRLVKPADSFADQADELGRWIDKNRDKLDEAWERAGMEIDDIGLARETLNDIRSGADVFRKGTATVDDLYHLRTNQLAGEMFTQQVRKLAPELKLPGMFSKTVSQDRAQLFREAGMAIHSTADELGDKLQDAIVLGFYQGASKTPLDVLQANKGLLSSGFSFAKNRAARAGASTLGKTIGLGAVVDVGLGGGVTSAALGAAPEIAALGAVGKTLDVAFRDPVLGGAVSSGIAQALDSAKLFHGDDARGVPSRDQRTALRSFAERVRSTDSNHAASEAAKAFAGSGQEMQAADIARRRVEHMQKVVDREMPQASPAKSLIRPTLPSSAASRNVVESLRATSSPHVFLDQLLSGKLTRRTLESAEAVFPQTVAAARSWASAVLAARGGGDGLPERVVSSIEMLLSATDPSVEADRAVRLQVLQAGYETKAPSSQQGGKPLAVSTGFSDRISKASAK